MTDVTDADRELRSTILRFLVDTLGKPCADGDMPDDRNDELDRIIAAHRQATASSLAAENERLVDENFKLAAGVCIYPNGNGLFGDEHGNSICGVEHERERLDQQVTDLMARINQLESALETIAHAARSPVTMQALARAALQGE